MLSGPSGVGKDALLDRLRKTGAPYHFAITATTRPMRPDERDGVDYIFVTRPRFEQMIGDDDLLEWAEVHGHLYGVPRSQLAGGRDVVLQVDVQGAATIRKLVPDAVFIFLEPPDMDAAPGADQMGAAPDSLPRGTRKFSGEIPNLAFSSNPRCRRWCPCSPTGRVPSSSAPR